MPEQISLGIVQNIFTAADLTSPAGIGPVYALSPGSRGPQNIAWQIVFSANPATWTFTLEASLDGINFSQLDQATQAALAVRKTTGAVRFIRINNTVVTGGAGISVNIYLLYTI